jgi:putative transcription factor
MECELCGKNAELVRAKIEGTVISVCVNCSRLGKTILEAKPVQMKARSEIIIDTIEINPRFADMIKTARETAGLSREELATKINEKLAVIERAEHGHRPTDAAAHKIEKALGINLLGYEQKDVKDFKSSNKDLTIGDIAIIRKKK